MKNRIAILFGLLVGGLSLQFANATQITPGFTYAVASGGGAPATGNHYHSNTGGAFGNPAGKAEVGSYGSEEVRGLSEYDLTGLASGPAFVTFNVFKAGGLFASTNGFPFTGTIDVYSYQGNNSEDISDYQATPTMFVGSLSTAGLAVGNTISLGITSQFNGALTNSWSSLGIRLQRNGGAPNSGGAWTFDSFRLTSTNDSTNVPETGATLALLGIALTGLAGVRRKLKN